MNEASAPALSPETARAVARNFYEVLDLDRTLYFAGRFWRLVELPDPWAAVTVTPGRPPRHSPFAPAGDPTP